MKISLNTKVQKQLLTKNINTKAIEKMSFSQASINSQANNNFNSYEEIAPEELSMTDYLKSSSPSFKSPAGLDYSQIEKEGYTAQGYTTYGDQVLITGYSHGENSHIYVYDNNTGELTNTIILNNKAHVGGMSVDENGILFVTKTQGKIETYDLKGLQKEFGENTVIDFSTEGEKYNKYKIKNNIDTGESEATLYCYDGKVYTATYSGKGTIKEIAYSYENGKIDAQTKVITKDAASTIQGISVYKDASGNEYLITASSSKNIGSRIRIYEKKEDELYRVASCNTRLEGLEGIKVEENGDITGICEYGEQTVKDLGNVDEYINSIKKSNIDFFNNDILFAMSGLVWDLKH